MAGVQAEGELRFAINGEEFVLPAASVDPNVTLNSFLRRQTRYKGTKLSCGEGGCGACAVDLSRIDPVSGREVHLSVNSCLRPLAALDGWAVTTTEGIGSSRTGHHPIQERIANFHGSQCGFCTPGMVMTMYSTLRATPEVTMEQVESRFDGNLCRCTGYRPILDACKSFATDSDIEDLVGCGKALEHRHEQQAAASQGPEFPSFLAAHDYSRRLAFVGARGAAQTPYVWLRPSSLEQAFEDLARHGAAARVVVGNTGVGIYKQEQAQVLVDLGSVADLLRIEVEAEVGVRVGASVSIARLEETLLEHAASGAAERVRSFSALAKHVRRVANVHVRNAGSVAGNLMLAKSRGFLSDLATILLGARATVTLAAAGGHRHTVSIDEFLATPTLPAGELVHSITVPFTKADANVHFHTFKTALRAQNSHAYVNAAFYFELDHESRRVLDCTLAFGGIGADDQPGTHAVRALATEQLLHGRELNGETLAAALASLKAELRPSSDDEHAFRHRLVTGFFFKNFTAIAPQALAPVAASAARDVSQRPVSHGRQRYRESVSDEHTPVSKPIAKLGATLQASGEAVYVDDLPLHRDTVFGVLVTAKRPHAILKSIDSAAARALPGVVAVLTAADVPHNNCSAIGQTHPVLADTEVKHHGQPVALVLADTELHATAAAQAVVVHYDDEASAALPVVFTTQQALQHHEQYKSGVVNSVGQEAAAVEAALAAVPAERRVRGTVHVGSQQHFYMEPHVAYAVPDEDGGIAVHSPHQWPAAVQGGVASSLKLPLHKVRIVHRRAGGGFGGKITHSAHVAALAAVAAHRLQRPVRLALDRHTDSGMFGGREETDATYEVAFERDGRVVALKVDGYLNCGFTPDLSGFVNNAFVSALSQAYRLPHLRVSSEALLTNLPTRTAVRGPGEIAASYVIETVLEHVAHATGLDAELVRRVNFFDAATDGEQALKAPNGTSLAPYTVPRLWEQLKAEAEYEAKLAAVRDFNRDNRWKKRGLSMTPVRYEVSVWPKEALVNVYADGSVLVTHTGAEIGQGMHTKVAQVVAYEFSKLVDGGVDIGLVRFGDMDTNVNPNGMFTGGSTGSEGSAEAARRCCQTINARLAPVIASVRETKAVEALKAATPDADEAAIAAAKLAARDDKSIAVSWTDAISAARAQSVNLSAQDAWTGTGETALTYHNYGACLSVVELDAITGEANILSADMLYDCGKSLNPAIDIGQCEGAFMMGVGHVLREKVLFDEHDGALISDGTWEYKPPGVKDVPLRFNVDFLVNNDFSKGILNSKSSGEPPLVLAISVATAVRHAISASRADRGLTDFVPLDLPLTPQAIQAATAPEIEHFSA